MEVLIIVNLTAMLVALIFIALEVRKVSEHVQQGNELLSKVSEQVQKTSEQVSGVARMVEQTQRLILQALPGMPRA